MPKKIIKFFQTSVPKFSKQSIFLFGYENKDFKWQIPDLKKSKKANNNATFKNILKRKQKPGESLLSIFRSLSVSIEANFNRYQKIALFWRNCLSRILREKSVTKTTFLALNNLVNETVVSKQSRGNSTTAGPVDPCQGQQKKNNKLPKQNVEQEILAPSQPSLAKELNGIEEQKFYTEETYRKNLVSNLKQDWEETEINRNELPPPQKCRLSCPLPPPEFCSPELGEFSKNYLSPNVRFSSLPMLLIPKPNQTEEKLPSNNLTQSLSADSIPPSSDPPPRSIEPADATENVKIHSNFVPPSSQPRDSFVQDIPKMKALLFEPSTLKLKYEMVDAPIKIFKDEVLVQVGYSGVCGIDLFITEGKVSCGESPIILGHEISGRVYAVGSEVSHVTHEDKIAVNAYTACSLCRYCSRGLFSSCLNEGLHNLIGISKNGGWAEFVVVKKSQVYKIPDQLEMHQVALIQPLSRVLSAMSKLKIFHDMDILIQGLGLSGCLWASVLHFQGFKNVLVCDKIAKKSQFDSLDTNYSFIPPEDIGKNAVDLVVECTASPNSIERSLNILNPNGQMCFFRKPSPMTEVRCIPYELIRKEITIVGNAGNAFHFSKAIDLANAMGQRYLDFEKLGVKTFDLENFKEAFQQKKSEAVNKIIFKLDS